MKTEKLFLPGGLKIEGNMKNGEPFFISRLSNIGETRMTFTGLDADYDVAGQLIFANVRMVEFANSSPKQKAALPPEFSEAIALLEKTGMEIVAECDFVTGLVRVVIFDELDRTVLSEYNLDYYDKTLMPVNLTSGDEVIGNVGFVIEKLDEGLVRFGIGTPDLSMWVAQPKKVDMKLLAGIIDPVTMGRFILGVPPKKAK